MKQGRKYLPFFPLQSGTHLMLQVTHIHSYFFSFSKHFTVCLAGLRLGGGVADVQPSLGGASPPGRLHGAPHCVGRRAEERLGRRGCWGGRVLGSLWSLRAESRASGLKVRGQSDQQESPNFELFIFYQWRNGYWKRLNISCRSIRGLQGAPLVTVQRDAASDIRMRATTTNISNANTRGRCCTFQSRLKQIFSTYPMFFSRTRYPSAPTALSHFLCVVVFVVCCSTM